MEKNLKFAMDFLIRYLAIIIFGAGNLAIIYAIFTPLTFYFSYFFLKIFFNAGISGNIIFFDDFFIEIVPACVAGSAYYLLLLLNFSTRGIAFKKRILFLFFSIGIFFFANILRIFFFAVMAKENFVFFKQVHGFFWYFFSVFFVIAVWFAGVKIFKVKTIPFYSDIKYLFNEIKK